MTNPGDRDTLVIATGSHIGHVHHTNEDSLVVVPLADGRVLAVCDGMGGMGRGDEASAIAVRQLADTLKSTRGTLPDRACRALVDADVQIREELAVPGNSPGSTGVLLCVEGALVTAVWAGDSRAYWIRDSLVLHRTRDHKLVNELVDAGELTEAEAKNSALAHVVTKALGGRGPGEDPITPEVYSIPWKLHRGDHLLLCSDGLCDLVTDIEIAQMACASSDLEHGVRDLTQAALDRGGHDNITIILARWDGADFDDDAHETPVINGMRVDTPPHTERDEPPIEKRAADTLDPETIGDTPPAPTAGPTATEPPVVDPRIAIAVVLFLGLVLAGFYFGSR